MSLHVALRHRAGDFALAVDFAVGDGLAVLSGPSGAGKSLTLRLLAGLDRPDAGRVVLHGRVLTDAAVGVHVPVRERRVGIAFQQPLLLPHRSVLGNVALAVRGGGRRRRRAAALGWLERVGAADLAPRRPAHLSGGQQQRVALARALAGEPRLLLLDEPFNALDLPERRRLGALVRGIVAEASLPAILVTHDPGEVRALADRVIPARSGAVGLSRAPGARGAS